MQTKAEIFIAYYLLSVLILNKSVRQLKIEKYNINVLPLKRKFRKAREVFLDALELATGRSGESPRNLEFVTTLTGFAGQDPISEETAFLGTYASRAAARRTNGPFLPPPSAPLSPHPLLSKPVLPILPPLFLSLPFRTYSETKRVVRGRRKRQERLDLECAQTATAPSAAHLLPFGSECSGRERGRQLQRRRRKGESSGCAHGTSPTGGASERRRRLRFRGGKRGGTAAGKGEHCGMERDREKEKGREGVRPRKRKPYAEGYTRRDRKGAQWNKISVLRRGKERANREGIERGGRVVCCRKEE